MRQWGARLLVLVLGAATLVTVKPATAAVGGEPTCGGRSATIVGTDRRDRLTGTDGDDVIVGLGGDDVLRGGAGDDVICGGAGSDKLVGGEGTDELRGGLSRVVRGDGEVAYYRDHLVGGEGDDVLVPGDDGHSHENRWDLLDFSDAAGPIVADVAADTVTGIGNDVVIGDHYAIFGSRYDDTLIGDDGDDELYGWDGADELRGGAGEDDLHDSGTYFRPGTAPGDDLLDGGPGDDRIDIGDGFDTAFGRGGDDDLVNFSLDGADLAAGPGDDDLTTVLVVSDAQSVRGGEGSDEAYLLPGYLADGERIYPRTMIDLAVGFGRLPAFDLTFRFAGTESLLSYLPALTWVGSDGPDRLDAEVAVDPHTRRLIADGRAGNDRISGTNRADEIDGGPGYDRANGQGGADTCVDVEVARYC